MNGSLRWIAAAAAVVLIAVVGFAVLGRPSDSEVAASPSPTAESSPTSSPATTIPDALEALWVGETRFLPEARRGSGIARSSTSSNAVAVYRSRGRTHPRLDCRQRRGPDRITFTSMVT